MTGIRILATGSRDARRAVTNDDMARLVETSDEWIRSRTGIGERRFAGEGESTATLAAAAAGEALRALEERGRSRAEVGAVLVATFTPSDLVPNTACLVQRELGLPEDILALDINAACSGFLAGLRLAQGLLEQQPGRLVLLIGAEVISRVTDFSDRGTCVLFGDGAGAAVLAADPERPFWWAGGARGGGEALSCAGIAPGNAPVGKIRMNGKEVFRFAVEAIPAGIREVLRQSGEDLAGVDWFLCHQANARILSHAAKSMGVPLEKFYMNLDRYGNTSAASIPVALDEMDRRGLLREGMKLMLAGFGGGLTWGAAQIIW